MASSSTPARRRRGGFGRFFLIWCLALALIGVLVLAKPFTGAQFRQAVQIAASSYKRLAVLRTENAKLLDKIAQLRLVDRAKCYLIEKKGYTETDAHRLIEKRAMDTRMSRGEVAQEILEDEDEE